MATGRMAAGRVAAGGWKQLWDESSRRLFAGSAISVTWLQLDCSHRCVSQVILDAYLDIVTFLNQPARTFSCNICPLAHTCSPFPHQSNLRDHTPCTTHSLHRLHRPCKPAQARKPTRTARGTASQPIAVDSKRHDAILPIESDRQSATNTMRQRVLSLEVCAPQELLQSIHVLEA
jgi:hypothetical protein